MKYEYHYCPFCGENKMCKRKTGSWGDREIEWFICFDCDRETL